MPGPGVTLHLSLSEHAWTPTGAELLLERRIPAWIGSLAGAGRPARLVVPGAPALPGDAEHAVRRLAEAAGIELVDEPVDGDVVVLADAADLPGPHLVARLVAATTEDGVADARTFPVDLAADGQASTRPVGACLALTSARWQALGRETGAALIDRCRRERVTVTHRPEAAVWRDVRVDEDGVVEPRSSGVPHLPAWPPPTPASGHPAALPASTLAALATTTGLEPPAADRTERPFLSIITRTQGRRLQCLAEVFTCLAGQTSRDFELLLVCHRIADDAMAAVTELVDGLPAWLRERVRVVQSTREGRAAPLNDGFLAAEGRYVVALDDDDTVLAHWVETFRDAEQSAAGTVLRSGALRQDVVPLEVGTEQGPATCPLSHGPAHVVWPHDFDLLAHLRGNYSPFMTVAFPRGVLHGLGQRFDEALDTTEDWQFLVRAAALVGVTDTRVHTSVYRWWAQEGSRALHDEQAWAANDAAVRRTFDDQVLLLPRGSAHVVADIQQERDEARAEIRTLAASQQQVIEELQEVVAAHDAAVASRDAFQARTAELESRVAELQQRQEERQAQQEERLDLMREAHALLVSRRAEVPGGRSLFDLNRRQLRRLIARLTADEAARPRRRLLGQR